MRKFLLIDAHASYRDMLAQSPIQRSCLCLFTPVRQVFRYGGFYSPDMFYSLALKQNGPGAKPLDRGQIVAHEQHGPPQSGNVFHLAQTLFLKLDISDCQNLVHQKNVWLEMGGHSESQPDIHSTGIVLHRSVEKFLHFGEVDDLIKFAIDFRPGHTEDGAVKIDIFPPCQLAMETRTNLKQASHSAADLNTASGRLGDATEYF